jgi:hypothetical protein
MAQRDTAQERHEAMRAAGLAPLSSLLAVMTAARVWARSIHAHPNGDDHAPILPGPPDALPETWKCDEPGCEVTKSSPGPRAPSCRGATGKRHRKRLMSRLPAPPEAAPEGP